MVNGRPGVAPQTAKREEFTRLIAEGFSIAEEVATALWSGPSVCPGDHREGAGLGAVLVRG